MTFSSIRRAALSLALAAPLPVWAQTQASADTMPPPAAPADVQSIDAIIHATYDVISGPAGDRNWPRFYSLFLPGGQMVPTRRDSTGVHARVGTPQHFAQLAGRYFSTHGFYEIEIGRETNTFGAITQVFSAYASRNAPEDPKPFQRGINSFQLFNDGRRWYVVSIFWDNETPTNAIPARYVTRQR
jgi:hypothetical protein